MASDHGPDGIGRYWDEDYGEVEFLACVMECGTQTDYKAQNPYLDYWAVVDTWFERHFPERWAKVSDHQGDTFTCQMGFKIALWDWLGEHEGAVRGEQDG